ncbi:MAG: SDR family NAD(P)-dependent oxidoreductase [Candidatus Obscuribacterales bacterium]|nr:SDR family NAD(P)-dependent oxidoreductase [Candidatus Obscuribacterales bacterium]
MTEIDRICLISGATSGIGRAAALELASSGFKIIVLGRDETRCLETVNAIVSANPEPERLQPDHFVADLSSYKDIVRVACQIKEKYDRIDVLINNAGAIFTSDRKSVDGIELTWALNHFGYFWLTTELLELLVKGSAPRIINVSSRAHVRARIKDMVNIVDSKTDWFFTYSNTKLANIWFTIELADRLKEKGITVNCLHPGVVATRFGRGSGPGAIMLQTFATIFGVTPEKGAETIVYLARSPVVEGVTGKYFVNKKAVEPSLLALDIASAKRLWQVSAEKSDELSIALLRYN